MRRNAQKKEKTRRETTAIKVWVTPAEKAAITVKANAYSLSASTYWRELISDREVIITPLFPLVDMIPAFGTCPRRIYMSATISLRTRDSGRRPNSSHASAAGAGASRPVP